MDVEVRLFATLRAGRFRRRTVQMAAASTLGDLLAHLGIRAEQTGMRMVNGLHSEIDRALQDGDVVSLFPAIGGG